MDGHSGHVNKNRRVGALLGFGLLLIAGLQMRAPVAFAHNLQTRMVYMFFDADTQACIDARLEGTPLPAGCAGLPSGWQVGDPVLQAGDELGVIIKVVPRDGTTTGVGGHIDFYVPNGVEVTDVARHRAMVREAGIPIIGDGALPTPEHEYQEGFYIRGPVGELLEVVARPT